jgi:SAM-dependent methyltransferase
MLEADFYRKLYSDLQRMTPEEAQQHYLQYGIAEGRQASSRGSRTGIIEFLQGVTRVLEIGPFDRPMVYGPSVKYADYLSREELKCRAQALERNPDGVPFIHFILAETPLKEIPLRFGAVVSSHCIEHQPDLIRHLQDVELLLEPNGLAVFLIPDKRYCFDHFLSASSIADVLTAYHRNALVHDIGSVIEHWALTTHNDSARHWRGDHGRPVIEDAGLEPVRRAMDTFDRNPNAYVDVHAWQFTPSSFAAIVRQLKELGLVNLEIAELHHTLRDSNEFIAVLQRPRPTASR